MRTPNKNCTDIQHLILSLEPQQNPLEQENNNSNPPLRPLLPRSHPIKPVVRRHEIPSRIPHNRYLDLSQCFYDVLAEAILIREWAFRIVDAAIDAAA